MNIDLRTVVFLTVIIFITCTLFIVQLWWQNRSRYAGMVFLVLDFFAQTAALMMIVLRGTIPDWISIVISNFLVIAGSIAGYSGLLLFLGKKNRQIHNYLFLLAFTCVHIYFTFISPSLEFRNLNISTGLLFICFQCSWLLLRSVEPGMRHLTLWVGVVFGGYCAVSLVRIAQLFISIQVEVDYFHSGVFHTEVFVSYMMLFILLTYSLVIMVNKRLLMEIAGQEEKFSKAFHSAPYAIILTRLSDGTIVDTNDSFAYITGYEREEVIGSRTMDLHVWINEKDRDGIIELLAENGKAHGLELGFRRKNGELMTGLLSADIIIVNGEKMIMANIADISKRKLAEDEIKYLLAEKEIILKEVHHRIKNNMNTINSLLTLQAETINEPHASAALGDAGSRVQSMMVLYDKLYQSENINEVPVKEYIPALIDQIITNFPNSGSVKIKTSIDDFILDAKIVSSLGIIINELLTNIMKYAFTGRDDGIIIVSAAKKGGNVSFIIQDNGSGIPEEIDIKNSTGFGFSLVEMLTKQIDGTIRIERQNGTKFILEFRTGK